MSFENVILPYHLMERYTSKPMMRVLGSAGLTEMRAAIVCRGQMQTQALLLLTAAVEKKFPKVKKEACLREIRKVGLLRARESKKSAAPVNSCFIGNLPDHILNIIFEKLAPIDLSRAACVSNAWMSLAHADDLWAKYLPLGLRNSSDIGQRRKRFLGDFLL